MKIPIKVRILSVTWYLGLMPVGMLFIDSRWHLIIQIIIGLLLLGLGVLVSRALIKHKKWAWICSLILGWALAVVFVAPVIMFNLGIFRLPSFMNVLFYLLSVGATYWMLLSSETRHWVTIKHE